VIERYLTLDAALKPVASYSLFLKAEVPNNKKGKRVCVISIIW
jgi:hypothetical protein